MLKIFAAPLDALPGRGNLHAMATTAIARAVRALGGVEAAAQAVRVTPQTVRLWLRRGGASAPAARLISELTGISERALGRGRR